MIWQSTVASNTKLLGAFWAWMEYVGTYLWKFTFLSAVVFSQRPTIAEYFLLDLSSVSHLMYGVEELFICCCFFFSFLFFINCIIAHLDMYLYFFKKRCVEHHRWRKDHFLHMKLRREETQLLRVAGCCCSKLLCLTRTA